MVALALALVVSLALLAAIGSQWRQARRAQFIRTYSFPRGLIERLQRRRPALNAKDSQLVARALRQFFLAHLVSGRRFVSMPSQVVDDLWHEFILYTREYERFCRRAFGSFLHHTPAVVLGANRQDNAGLRRVWWYCCREENIHPRRPSRLPLLFALDAKLQIPDGFRYAPHCDALQPRGPGDAYCGGDFLSERFDGSLDGLGDGGHGHGGHGDIGGSGGNAGDGGGADGGDGGGGCGGGD